MVNTNTSMSVNLPSYRKPPVNEVVCGMRFKASEQLKIHHYGLLWEKFSKEYPKVEHAPHLFSSTNNPHINISNLPLPRVWFINESDDQLVQFQEDRFYFNWRRKKNEYPRYTYVIKQFQKSLNTIQKFFSENNLGDFQPIEYELSYINHIAKGEGWEGIEDFNKVFADYIWNPKSDLFLPHPIDLVFNIVFPLKNNGILTVSLKRAIRLDDNIPLFLVEMKATGSSTSYQQNELLQWFDIAHESIVKGFTEITNPIIHKIWEREK